MSDGAVVDVERAECDSLKFGYICMRGAGHEPADLHAQLVSRPRPDKLRVAVWMDDKAGVSVRLIDAPEHDGPDPLAVEDSRVHARIEADE